MLAGVLMKRLVSSEQADGRFCLFENQKRRADKDANPCSCDDDETIYVIEGHLTAIWMARPDTLAGREHLSEARHPAAAHEPQRSAVRYILIATPGIFEEFLSEAGHELRKGEVVGPPTPAISALKAAAPRFGITLL